MTTRPASDRSHDLLPWYANGTLGEDESRAFREHLRQCEACREEMDAIEQIRSELEQHGEALLEEHPTSERLVATVSGELKGPEAATVRRHIALLPPRDVPTWTLPNDPERRPRSRRVNSLLTFSLVLSSFPVLRIMCKYS